MKLGLTMQVESWLGAALLVIVTCFMIGVLFVAISNYDSDTIELNASQTRVRTITSTERQIIARWVNDTHTVVPEGKGYRYLVQQYPDRPWLSY